MPLLGLDTEKKVSKGSKSKKGKDQKADESNKQLFDKASANNHDSCPFC